MKIVLISSLMPSGHYSRYVVEGLIEHDNVNLIVYSDKDKDKDKDKENINFESNDKLKVIEVWPKNSKFLIAIIKKLIKDKPDIVHLQHEINMFGGALTAIIFPWLVASIRLMGIPTVVTIHSVVPIEDLDNKFGRFFFHESILSSPIIYKIVFNYLYKFIGKFASAIIVHTKMTSEILKNDYSVKQDKIYVIKAIVPIQKECIIPTESYFFYFGYIARRKGIDQLLEGFKGYLSKNCKSSYKLILAGGVIKGQEKAREEIINKIIELDISHKVELRGFINEKEQNKLYKEAYAVVIPAVMSMGSSGPLYHATSYGKAVLCSKVGHFLEDVEDGITGLLVSNDNWAKAFEYAVAHPEHISKMATEAKIRAKIRSPKNTTALYLNRYNDILKRKI